MGSEGWERDRPALGTRWSAGEVQLGSRTMASQGNSVLRAEAKVTLIDGALAAAILAGLLLNPDRTIGAASRADP